MRVCLSFSAENVGGEYKHTLIVDEIPNHNHNGCFKWYGSTDMGDGHWNVSMNFDSVYSIGNWPTFDIGGGLPHNNLQPYIVVYYWKRVS